MVVSIEEFLEGWAKVFDNHSIVIALCSEPVNRWDANDTCEALIDLVFMLELDGDILFCNNIGSAVNNTYNIFQ